MRKALEKGGVLMGNMCKGYERRWLVLRYPIDDADCCAGRLHDSSTDELSWLVDVLSVR